MIGNDGDCVLPCVHRMKKRGEHTLHHRYVVVKHRYVVVKAAKKTRMSIYKVATNTRRMAVEKENQTGSYIQYKYADCTTE